MERKKPVRPEIRRMSKLELHLHFEGTAEPELIGQILSRREGAAAEDIGRLYEFSDFSGFLQAYRRVNEALREPGDFYRLAQSLARRLESQKIIYAELTFTPLLHTRLGLDHDEVIRSILEGLGYPGKREGGAEVAFIYDTVRQWGAEAARDTLALALADRAAGLPVVGFGVGGDELSLPARELEEAFSLAASRGLKNFVHAGEVGGPESVWEAIDILRADRIGHGIAAARDPLLMKELARRGIALDICLTSNVMTGAVKSLAAHPWRKLAAEGVPITLGSDDPGFFGAWLEDELELAARTWGLGPEEIGALMSAAPQYCFLEAEGKKRLTRRLAGETGKIA